jgi:hypothetical protein
MMGVHRRGVHPFSFYRKSNMAKKVATTKNGKLSISQMRDLINKKAGTEVAYNLTEDNPTDVNEFITCVICKGYLIDATTITECLHTCES